MTTPNDSPRPADQPESRELTAPELRALLAGGTLQVNGVQLHTTAATRDELEADRELQIGLVSRAGGFAAAAAAHLNNARQILESSISFGAVAHRWCFVTELELEGIQQRLEAAANLLNDAIPAVLHPRELSLQEAARRISHGEWLVFARPAPDGRTCLECGNALDHHPTEFTRDGRRRICIPLAAVAEWAGWIK